MQFKLCGNINRILLGPLLFFASVQQELITQIPKSLKDSGSLKRLRAAFYHVNILSTIYHRQWRGCNRIWLGVKQSLAKNMLWTCVHSWLDRTNLTILWNVPYVNIYVYDQKQTMTDVVRCVWGWMIGKAVIGGHQSEKHSVLCSHVLHMPWAVRRGDSKYGN